MRRRMRTVPLVDIGSVTQATAFGSRYGDREIGGTGSATRPKMLRKVRNSVMDLGGTWHLLGRICINQVPMRAPHLANILQLLVWKLGLVVWRYIQPWGLVNCRYGGRSGFDSRLWVLQKRGGCY